MGSLVTEFLINPVLRQARRFSRSSQSNDVIDAPPTNQRQSQTDSNNNNDTAIEDISERLGHISSGGSLGQSHGFAEGNISGTAITSSPIVDDGGGLDAELRAIHDGRSSPSAPTSSTNAIPRRMLSLTSNSGQIDDEFSDNPSFGVPGRFRASSNTSNRSGVVHHGNRHSLPPSTMNSTQPATRQSTRDRSQGGAASPQMVSSLPEDDGMGYLRFEIRKIQSSDAPPGEKARLMHLLLTRDYTQRQTSLSKKPITIIDSAEVTISQERPTTPSSLASLLWQMNGVSGPAVEDHHTFHLSPTDIKPTYAPEDPPELDEEGDVVVKEIVTPQLGCKHYKRNVKMQCFDCTRWYTCRLCHDEMESHVLNRKATKNMLCMICSCAQKAAEFCVGCGERSAWYYCDVCKLWDNDSNHNIYHCGDCGICRKGRGLGKDFFHCKTCGTCMSMSVEKSHKCIERVSDCDCPICGEYMFDSPAPVVFMLCGHGIHRGCYDEHMKSSYKCPICSRSTVNMESQFRALDRAIDSQPMPPQFRDTKAMVSCNDCFAKSAVPYHWLGLKCAICDSYNTVQLSIISDPEVVPSAETATPQPNAPPSLQAIDIAAPNLPRSTPGPLRLRRHSSHMHVPFNRENSGRFSPYAATQRFGRSVSPIPGLGFFLEETDSTEPETDESVAGDDLDFWGREEPRIVTSTESVHDERMEEEESDEDSADSDCEDDDNNDDNDPFELLGHR